MKLISSISALFVSRACVALSGFLLVPLYLEKLGSQPLGMLTLMMSLQACMMVFDLGLSTAATTRAAQTLTEAPDSKTEELLKIGERAYWCIGLVFCLLLMFFWYTTSDGWIRQVVVTSSPKGWDILALTLACLSLAATWPQNYYAAVLNGLHRQQSLAMIVIVCAILKLLVMMGILYLYANLLAVFTASLAIAIFQSLWMSVAARRTANYPRRGLGWSDLKSNLQKSIDKNLLAISAIGTLLAQGDKIFLSGLLSASDFAAYSVAAMLCASLYMLINPLYSILLPHFVKVLASNQPLELRQRYAQASEMAAILVIPAGSLLIFFAPFVLEIWLRDGAVIKAATPVLLWLAVGTTAHGLLYVPYSLQLASSWTSLALRMNMALLLVSVPLLYLGSKVWGSSGAAACWAFINLSFLIIWPALMHRRLLPGMALAWMVRYVVVPVATTACVMSLLRYGMTYFHDRLGIVVMYIVSAYACSLFALILGLPGSRAKLLQYVKRLGSNTV